MGSLSLQIKTYVAPLDGQDADGKGTIYLPVSPSSNKLNGSLSEAIIRPFVTPEKLVFQVEALLKREISGLDTIIIQCETSKAPTTKDDHSHNHDDDDHNHSSVQPSTNNGIHAHEDHKHHHHHHNHV